MFQFKLPEKYDMRPPSKTTIQFDKDATSDITLKYCEVTCKSDFNMRKCAAGAIKKTQFGIGTLVYDKLMRHWIKTELGIEIPCVTEVMDKVCWCCGKENENLKRCKGEYCFKSIVCLSFKCLILFRVFYCEILQQRMSEE